MEVTLKPDLQKLCRSNLFMAIIAHRNSVAYSHQLNMRVSPDSPAFRVRVWLCETRSGGGVVASYPGRVGGERRPGINCLRMRDHSQKNQENRLGLEIVGKINWGERSEPHTCGENGKLFICIYICIYVYIYVYIRESVDSLCRDGADAQYMQYLSKSRITSPQTR